MLTQEEQRNLMERLIKTRGCPCTVNDRLSAYTEGLCAAVASLASMISLDDQREAPKEQKEE